MCLANSIEFVQVFSVDFFASKQTVSPSLDKNLTLGRISKLFFSRLIGFLGEMGER